MNATLTLRRSAGFSQLFETFAQRHSPWWRTTVLFIGLTVVFGVLAVADDRMFNGVSTWAKPLKFSLSLAVYFATLAWFAPLMPHGYFEARKGRVLTNLPIVCAVLEIAYIALQAGRGEASHYNNTSMFYSLLYSLMGIGALSLVVVCAWMATAIAKRSGARDAYAFAVVVGMWMTLVLGGGFGGYMAAQPGHWVGGAPTDAGGWWLMKWARDGGDLRVAHFFGMHAMQVLPVVGWLAGRSASRRTAIALVVAAACLYAAFSTFTFLQAIAGRPFV
jgi:uncharacterized membrane protein YGL010W